ncbi:hypothetical protein DL93DRAFT_1881268 [Clavulina sp. PMI_390]|nr:hypothetical protein DL93DRAFT_1881268 [Clavulina sp. PMI_390]
MSTQDAVERLASKPYPAYALSALLLGSSFVPPARAALLPPFYQRFGFGLIFSGAGYVLGTGDVRNGSGIATSWSLMYLFLNLRSSFRATPARSPLSMLLSVGALSTASLYGSEYFWVLPDQEVSEE